MRGKKGEIYRISWWALSDLIVCVGRVKGERRGEGKEKGRREREGEKGERD